MLKKHIQYPIPLSQPRRRCALNSRYTVQSYLIPSEPCHPKTVLSAPKTQKVASAPSQVQILIASPWLGANLCKQRRGIKKQGAATGRSYVAMDEKELARLILFVGPAAVTASYRSRDSYPLS